MLKINNRSVTTQIRQRKNTETILTINSSLRNSFKRIYGIKSRHNYLKFASKMAIDTIYIKKAEQLATLT